MWFAVKGNNEANIIKHFFKQPHANKIKIFENNPIIGPIIVGYLIIWFISLSF